MSNTAKVHSRFWDAMRARFGTRWLEQQGNEPTDAWKQVVNKFTPDDLRKALDLMGQDSKRVHPPTLPEFETYLRRAQAKAPDNVDHSRAYWRGIVVGTCMRHAFLLNIVRRDAPDLRALPPDVYAIALRVCQELLDWTCDTERKNGQRTQEMEHHVNTELWRVLQIYRRADPPAEPERAPVNAEFALDQSTTTAQG